MDNSSLSPEETGADSPPIYYSREATMAAAAASLIFMVVGVSGNLITILALSRSVKLRAHATTAFVISLCVSDLLFCSINMPLTASRYIFESWVLGDFLCRIFPLFFYGNVAASLFNMVAITINRYILIAHHGIYERVYRRGNILLMIAFVWLFSFAMMFPPFFEAWGRLGLKPSTFSCTILEKDGASPKKFLFLFGFLIPCIAIIFCYSAIYCKVHSSRKKMLAHSSLSSHAPSVGSTPLKVTWNKTTTRKEDLRLTRMMVVIFVCFLLSFLPLMVVNVVDDEDVSVPLLHIVASILAWASAVINPFVYAVANRQYRAAYRKLFSTCCVMADKSRMNNSKSNSSKTFITDLQYNVYTDQVTSPSPSQSGSRNS